MSLQTAKQYFESRPNEKDGVLKAYFAYHAGHFRTEPEGHNFTNSLKSSRCVWCNRSREDVRHDDLPPQCSERPNVPGIADVILDEEKRAFSLLEQSEKIVSRWFKDKPVTGKELAVLKQTCGIDGDLACEILNVRFSAFESDYISENFKHSAIGRAAFTPTQITL